ncbi:MAG: hypothetical protein DME19_15575 [Verrucomicrobia bacterium]|nr:MAG: hypothetical protein DME19_15575 [Verrucomicrobiota bacterium]
MRRFHSIGLVALLGGLITGIAWADEFKLANGNVLRGELASADEDGLVVKLDVGGFSKREPWINFSQETLKELARNPKAAPLVEPFIELEPQEIKAKEKQKEIVVKPVPNRMERPTPKPSLAAAFLTPAGLTILVVLMLANLYAAYEIALFRQQPVPLVCGLSVLFPALVPLIFLSLPTRAAHGEAEAVSAEAEAGAGAEAHGGVKAKTTSRFPAAAAGGLSLAASSKPDAAPAPFQPQTFTRNRRFFETKFPGFFRMVPSETEKDLVIVVKAVRGEYVGKRISRISSNEMHLQLQSGNASAEVMVPFVEIQSVQIRHKDAKA